MNLRVFLEPQQSLRMGYQHTTFAIDWLCVSGAHTVATAFTYRISSSHLESHTPPCRSWPHPLDPRPLSFSACDNEPLTGSLLRQMGMEGRRPKRMLLVVM